MSKKFLTLPAILIVLMFSFVYLEQYVNAEVKDQQNFSLSTLQELTSLHQVKSEPGPYDWLKFNPEPGQTFAEFVTSQPVQPNEQRQFIYITLLGDFDQARTKIVEQMAQFVEAYYQLPVKFTDPIPLSVIPKHARRSHPQTQDNQILTSYVIEDVLKSRLPGDAFCFIAFTSSDLWPGEGWNFVFGQASLEDRVGVWSIYRNGDPNKSPEDYHLCLKRTVKTGTHEIGHMFSMHHCIFYECNMNGSNHRKESDNRPLWLCPVCLRKIVWSLKIDPMARYKDLIQISQQFQFNPEVKMFKESMEIFQKGSQ